MIYIEADTRRLLKVTAKRLGISEAQVVRDALDKHLKQPSAGAPRAVGCSTDGGVARRLDAALEESGFGTDAAG